MFDIWLVFKIENSMRIWHLCVAHWQTHYMKAIYSRNNLKRHLSYFEECPKVNILF
jgi:hypothetical protein